MNRSDATGADQTTVDYPKDAPVVTVDVRDDLRAGREPLQKLLAAVDRLQPQEVLQVRATFAPMPLVSLMLERGFVYRIVSLGEDDWSVWFWRPT